jgi:hypothetical protein
MADKLKSNQGKQARALWAAKGKEAFAVEQEKPGLNWDFFGGRP